MKITKVTFERLDLKLSEPYTIAYETINHTTNFILQIETDSKFIGRGCAAPDLVVTGEYPDLVETIIYSKVIPFLIGENPLRYIFIQEGLKKIIPNNPSVMAMVDMALLDLSANKLGAPLFQFLGGFRTSIPTSITIGILPLIETLEKAKNFVGQGFNIIKLKGGVSFEEDIEKILKLRELYPDLILRFDGNQGYDMSQALAFVEGTKSANIEIFEQPSHIDSELRLGEITENVNLPVMADESLKTLKDAFRLAQNERINMVNIKIMKVGGISEGLHINSVAKSANLEVMVGCIDECGLGIAAGLHFALSRPNIQYADLDGHLDILEDPYKNLFKIKNGIMYPNDKSGLGF